MNSEIKVIHTTEKVAKNGNTYTLVVCVIKIGNEEFIRNFAIFK